MNSFIENVNYVAGLDNLYGSGIELYKNNLSLKSVQHDIELKFSYYNNDDKKIHSIVHSEPGVLVGGIEDTLLSFKTLVESSNTGSEFTCTVSSGVQNFVINNIVMVNISIVSNSDMYKTYELEMKVVTDGVVTYDLFGEVKDSLKILPSLARITASDIDAMANLHEIQEEIVTVSESIANVTIVSDSIANVNTVGISISNVNIVGEDIANVNTVSTNISNVDIAATNIANIDIVATSIDNVTVASANISNINTVANAQNLADIIRVADDLNSLDVNGIADITIVANDLVLGVNSNIITVSESIDNVNITGNNIGNVNTVGINITDIGTVSTNIANVNTTATDISSVNNVSLNIADVNTVSDGITNVNIVSGSISNVNTVATNIVGLNSIVSNMTEILLADDNAAIATTKALESSDSAESSLQSATDAASSADSALSSATTATTKESEALVSANNAATSATNASMSETQSATSAGQSATSASSAANSAGDASASAIIASTQAGIAATKASDASVSANSAIVSKNDASSSATIALNSSSNAGISEVNAAISATSASASAATASAKASEASTSAANALASENSTSASENSAITSASTATTKAAEAVVSANSASYSASTSSTKASEASASASNALDSENKAEKWAEELEDVEVEIGKYSAKHWALKAEEFTNGSADNISYRNTISGLTATNVQAAIDEIVIDTAGIHDAANITTGTLSDDRLPASISSDITGNAATSSKWATSRTITLSGDVTGSVGIDGSDNVTITTSVAANSVTLGTDTTGNYVAGVTQGTGISVSGTTGEGWSPTITLTNVGASGTYRSVTTDAQGRVTSGTNPATVSDYGLTDVYTKTEVQTVLPKIGLDITNVTAPGVGQIAWNADEGTADLGLPGGSTLQIGQENTRTVRNGTANTITDGTVCMFAGTVGNSGRIKVAPYAGIKGTHKYIYGVATQNITAGSDGLITIDGKVRGIDTTGSLVGEVWADEDILYAKPNDSGRLTNVEPGDDELKIVVATVIHAHTNGTLEIRVLPIDENMSYTKEQSDSTFVPLVGYFTLDLGGL